MNQYQDFKRIFGTSLPHPPYPHVSYLVNWERARKLLAFKPGTLRDPWRTFLAVGLNHERVLMCVDPAIRELMDRLLRLPVVSMHSCSGHIANGRLAREDSPYLHLVFKDAEFGRKFLERIDVAFKQIRGVDHWFGGQECRACFGMSVDLPVSVCLKQKLPVGLYWHFTTYSPQKLVVVWREVGKVVASFDNGDPLYFNLADFSHRAPNDVPREWKAELARL